MTKERKYSSNFEVMIETSIPRKIYKFNEGAYSISDLMKDVKLMRSFVQECPDEAFRLYRSSRDWKDACPNEQAKVFLKTDVRVGEELILAYSGSSNYGVQVEEIMRSMRNKRMDSRLKESDDESGRFRVNFLI